MTGKEFLVLKAKIEDEFKNIEHLKEELSSRGLFDKCREDRFDVYFGNDKFKLRAVGSVLHDFYVAVENIFKTIAREIDETVPSDPSWHISLLKQMSVSIDGVRPPVISKETERYLDQYRAFRHVFRNVYGFNLDLNRIKALLLDFLVTLDLLRADLEIFQRNMAEILESD